MNVSCYIAASQKHNKWRTFHRRCTLVLLATVVSSILMTKGVEAVTCKKFAKTGSYLYPIDDSAMLRRLRQCWLQNVCGGVGVSYSDYNLSTECTRTDTEGCEALPAQYSDCLHWITNTTNDPQPCPPLLCCTDNSTEAQQQQAECDNQGQYCEESNPGQLGCRATDCPQGQMKDATSGACVEIPAVLPPAVVLPSPPPTTPPSPSSPSPAITPPTPLPPSPSPLPAPPTPLPPKAPTILVTEHPPLPLEPPPPPESPPPSSPPAPSTPPPDTPMIIIIDTTSPPPPTPSPPPPSPQPGAVQGNPSPSPAVQAASPSPTQTSTGGSPTPSSTPVYPPPPPSPPPPPDNYLGTQVSVTMTFPMDYSTVTSNTEAFVTDLETELSIAAELPKNNIKVTSVTSGSVIVTCDMLFPAATHTNADAAAFAMNAELLPAMLTSYTFKSKWSIVSSCTTTLRVINSGTPLPSHTSPPPPSQPGPARLSSASAGVVAVLVILLVPAAVVGGMYLWWRRRAKLGLENATFRQWLGGFREYTPWTVLQRKNLVRDEELRLQDEMMHSEPLGKMPRLVHGSLAGVRESLSGARPSFSSFGGMRGSLSGQKPPTAKSRKVSRSDPGESGRGSSRSPSPSRSPGKAAMQTSLAGARQQPQGPRRRQPSDKQESETGLGLEDWQQLQSVHVRSPSPPTHGLPGRQSRGRSRGRSAGYDNTEAAQIGEELFVESGAPSSRSHRAAGASWQQQQHIRQQGRESARSIPDLEEEQYYQQQQQQPAQQQQYPEHRQQRRQLGSSPHRSRSADGQQQQQNYTGPQWMSWLAQPQQQQQQSQSGIGRYRQQGPPASSSAATSPGSSRRHRDPWDEAWWPEEQQ